MKLSDFDYNLPTDLIAQEPAPLRDASRMLALDRGMRTRSDESFSDFPDHLDRGDVLVVNNTRVFPARLLGISETGAKVEIFLIAKVCGNVWQALARPARRLQPGKLVTFSENLSGRIAKRLDEGRVEIELDAAGDLDDALDSVGKTPLPPYIDRGAEKENKQDRERYQTIYAKQRGAIAAPTAGLHFTPDLLREIEAKGVEVPEITLHVGYGTFEPVRSEDLSHHSVLPERYEIDPHAAEILNRAYRDKRRIIAVGTTTTRTLETAIAKHGKFIPEAGTADLTITPGYKFKAIGSMLTNFHLPKSSLLILVSTFGGHELIMDAYRHAVATRYRFYSYGDCMFIE